MLSFPLLSLLTSVILAAVVSITCRRKLSNRLRGCILPPGPRGWPIVGNFFDLPNVERPWVVYGDWARKYGDLVFIKVLTTPMLIISSADIAFDLMDKRSTIYSDKPALVMDDLTGWEFNVGLMPYGTRWRNIRRIFHQYFNTVLTPKHRDKQTKEIHAFLRRCLNYQGKQLDPLLVRQTTAAIIMDVVYGISIQGMDDKYIKLALTALEVINETRVLGKFWIEFMPILKYVPSWVPGAASVKFGKRWRPAVEDMVNEPFDAVKTGVIQNPSMALSLITKLAHEQDPALRAEDEQHARHATGVAYAAGTDTTYSLIQTFFCIAAMHPEIQKKARDELDQVVGSDRLPTYEDHGNLPYIQAILMECIRWLPVFPLGVPHRLVTDDYYNQYFIPKGTIIIPNVLQMLRDPQDYPEPEKFYPERFLKDGAINTNVRDPSTLFFGFGRRVCPGKHFAKDTAFLIIASILHTFDVMPSLDQDGNELDPSPQMTGSIITCPDPLHYMLRPRSEGAERLIRATAK